MKFALTTTLLCLRQAAAGLAPRRGAGAWGFDATALNGARYFTQTLDHFNASEKRTWQQAYFVNDEHYEPGGPIFVYVGGEGPLGEDHSVGHNFVADWLPETKAILFGVEHRYYGCHNKSSCPYQGATPDYRYLSTAQALADLASFHAYATGEYKLPAAAKWVAWGGSYPGMLTAFVRARYPELFVAGVASSAPVHGIVDMSSFQDVITDAYAMDVEGVAGSPECAQTIAQGHATVGKLLGSDVGRQRLASLFPAAQSASWLADPDNQRTFAGCGVASFPAQVRMKRRITASSLTRTSPPAPRRATSRCAPAPRAGSPRSARCWRSSLRAPRRCRAWRRSRRRRRRRPS